MKALILIELDDSHLLKQTNDLYDRLKGYKCELKPMPKEEDIYEVGMDEEDTHAKQQWNKGWNACIDEILGEEDETDI